MTSTLPGTDDVAAAARRIGGYVRRTPTMRVQIAGRDVVLKLEQLQLTGSFKIRGALNALLGSPRPEHVMTASGGNHGLAVATAARLLEVPATVYVPVGVPAAKARRIEEQGATLVRHGDTYAKARDEATARAREVGALCLPAYDHPLVIAGQGTCAAEAVDQESDVDTVVAAVGGGGLVAGTALGAGGRAVVAVEPEHCAALHNAYRAGQPVESTVDSVAASALGASMVGELTYAVARTYGVVSTVVTDEQILAARDLLWEQFRLAVEPAGAAPLAAWLAGLVPGELACLVLCGANTDWTPS